MHAGTKVARQSLRREAPRLDTIKARFPWVMSSVGSRSLIGSDDPSKIRPPLYDGIRFADIGGWGRQAAAGAGFPAHREMAGVPCVISPG
ncbi:hypothetical protein BN2475_240026 [Paraburkholderia ribeironis]|uniref:Uncharacterized protein n=1 Tax=Paraburkholderia ribeironis TaxID=1247936 RepID=A0A1N7RY82_9BURK|nr:hypothetical protein BN2475_240026 [Paraburkholderia ribeironis]